MEYTCNAAVRTTRLRKTSQIEGNCFPQQGQPVSGQAVWKRQLFINGARAAGAGSGQATVTTQLKVQLGTGVTAWHLSGMEAIRCWIVYLGMVSQSSCSTANSSSGVAGGTFCTLRRQSSSSHKCSIGLRSGLSDGQGRVRMF